MHHRFEARALEQHLVEQTPVNVLQPDVQPEVPPEVSIPNTHPWITTRPTQYGQQQRGEVDILTVSFSVRTNSIQWPRQMCEMDTISPPSYSDIMEPPVYMMPEEITTASCIPIQHGSEELPPAYDSIFP